MTSNPDDNLDYFLMKYNYAGAAGGLKPTGDTTIQLNDKYVVTYNILDDEAIASTYYDVPTQLASFKNNYVSTSSSSPSYNSEIEDAVVSMITADPASDAYGALFQHVAMIDFQTAVASSASINIAQAEVGAFSNSNVGAVTIEAGGHTDINVKKAHGDIWVNLEFENSSLGGLNQWNYDSNSGTSAIQKGTWSYKALMEEVLHSLGVDVYNPEDGLSPTSSNVLNSHQYTVTSYIVHPGMTFDTVATGAGSYPLGLQIYDIYALQEIYGINWDTRATNTTYSKSTAFSTNEANDAFVYTIWDGDGEDTIDASGYSGHTISAIIDLRQGEFSSIGRNTDGGGASNNVAIAYNAIIENAKGTDEGDVLIGNAWNNRLWGEDGSDRIFGDGLTLEDDEIVSQYYDNDIGYGTGTEHHTDNPEVAAASNGSGDDELYGGAGDDWLWGGLGDDLLDGGDDFDNVDYRAFDVHASREELSSVTVSVTDRSLGKYTVEYDYNTLTDEEDTLVGIERVAHAERNTNTHYQNLQTDSTIAGLKGTSGGYVVAWESKYQEESLYSIRARRFDDSGNPIGGEIDVSSLTVHQYDPAVAGLNNGGFVVAYQSKNEAPYNDNKTFISIFNASGSATTTDFQVFEDPKKPPPYETQLDPDFDTQEYAKDVAVMQDDGNIIVVAEAFGTPFTSGRDIIGQIITPGGARVGDKFVINDGVAGNQTDPAVSALDGSGYVVTWTGTDSSYKGIFVRAFDSDGTARGASVQANTTTLYDQKDSDVTGLEDGGFVVTWTGYGDHSGSGLGIYMQKFDASGTKVGSEVLVNEETNGGQIESQVVALEDGGFLVTFRSDNATGDGSGSSVWGQQYDKFGGLVKDNFLINVTSANGQYQPEVAGLKDGDFALSWSSKSTTYDDGSGTLSASTEVFNRFYNNSAEIPTRQQAMSGGGGSGSSSALMAPEETLLFAETDSLALAPIVAPVDRPLSADARSDDIFRDYRSDGATNIFGFSKEQYAAGDVRVIDSFDTEEGDMLNFHDILQGVGRLDKAIEDFFQVSESDNNSVISIDRDGAGERYDFQDVVQLQATPNIDIAALIESGNVLV
ncbi:MAG: M10 family metallopeptidase C-terminal domain-containing protein [Pseudomonadota bacterium]